MMRPAIVALTVSSTLACTSQADTAAGEPGAPLTGLTALDSARFLAGQSLFNKIFTQEEGLGPAFNENQCSACHTVPAIGGTTGFERIVKATHYRGPGACDLLSAQGGENIRSNATPLLRAQGIRSEAIPAGAADTGRFLPPFLFGLGLIEAIPEETILLRADPADTNGDGISGRAARGPDGRLTRFGRKADFATIDDFNRGALRHEMGLTSGPHERDLINGVVAPKGTDPKPEPEVTPAAVALLTDFVRFLAAPRAMAHRNAAHADTLIRGRSHFDRIGCAKCHTPVMRTGPNPIPALSRKNVNLYSDLLLHDLGPSLKNVCATDAAPQELRTTPLMGLRHRKFFLHDGRANDLHEAILDHGGEAQRARDLFRRLSGLNQEYLLIFLRSL